MKNILTLTEKQTHFLDENRQDPITGDGFEIGDEIVFCAECKSAFLRESWEYMGNKHCNQIQTLNQIPKAKKLEIRKIVESTCHVPKMTEIAFSWMIDTLVWLIINVLVWQFSKDYFENTSVFYKIVAILTLLLKDNNLIVTSLGKFSRGISIVYLKNHKKVSPLLFPLHHVISSISLALVLFVNHVELVVSLAPVLFCICLSDILFQFDKTRRIIDYILGTATRQDNDTEEIGVFFQEGGTSVWNGYQDPTSLE
ncbi:hypothetical protein [Bernardetia sp. MNP-M8]|uniref:hypothetical protein n=1 Tax=Bernardetia sp. MNP-M8 TaxID=3127470 RepID=UPI0030CF76B7